MVGIARLRKGKISHPIVRSIDTRYVKEGQCLTGSLYVGVGVMIRVKCENCSKIVDATVHGIYPKHIYVVMKHHRGCSLIGWPAQWKDIVSPKEQVQAEDFFHAIKHGDHDFW